MQILARRVQQCAAHVIDHRRVGFQHRAHGRIAGGGEIGRPAGVGNLGQCRGEVIHHQLVDGIAYPGLGLVVVLYQAEGGSGFGSDGAQRNSVLSVLRIQVQWGVANAVTISDCEELLRWARPVPSLKHE